MRVVLLVREVRRRGHQFERGDRTVGCRGWLDIAGVSRARPIDDGHESQRGGKRQRRDLLHLSGSFLEDGATGVMPGCVVGSPRREVIELLLVIFQRLDRELPTIHMTSRLGG
jgi:hypothetical protein